MNGWLMLVIFCLLSVELVWWFTPKKVFKYFNNDKNVTSEDGIGFKLFLLGFSFFLQLVILVWNYAPPGNNNEWLDINNTYTFTQYAIIEAKVFAALIIVPIIVYLFFKINMLKFRSKEGKY